MSMIAAILAQTSGYELETSIVSATVLAVAGLITWGLKTRGRNGYRDGDGKAYQLLVERQHDDNTKNMQDAQTAILGKIEIVIRMLDTAAERERDR